MVTILTITPPCCPFDILLQSKCEQYLKNLPCHIFNPSFNQSIIGMCCVIKFCGGGGEGTSFSKFCTFSSVCCCCFKSLFFLLSHNRISELHYYGFIAHMCGSAGQGSMQVRRGHQCCRFVIIHHLICRDQTTKNSPRAKVYQRMLLVYHACTFNHRA